MAYKLEARIHRWIGLSTDTKPTPGSVGQEGGAVLTAADVPAGSTFKDEFGYVSTFNGTEWSTPAPETNPIVDAITLLTAEVARLRLGMIDMGTASDVEAA